MKQSAVPSIYALLIACDFYFPNITSDEKMFLNLRGCVRDITAVDDYLKAKMNVPQDQILKLKASYTGGMEPPEPKNEWPTYQNIVAGFKKIDAMATEGDQIYIHYSGHGGRALTAFPEVKGENGIDETLVPIDIEDLSTRYVRDLELAQLLKDMVDKGRYVTVVLDSCHSGGMTRASGMPSDSAVRGGLKVDMRPRPTESDVAHREVLITNWRSLVQEEKTSRGMEIGPGWLPDPKGYVFLAACRQDESAIEYPFNGTDRSGALTHWLLLTLDLLRADSSWKEVHNVISGKITRQFKQTPQLLGEIQRRVFGLDEIYSADTIRVLQYETDGMYERVELDTGEATGAWQGAIFAIYPAGRIQFGDSVKRLAVVKIDKVGATRSWAVITQKGEDWDSFNGNEQAILIESGAVVSKGKVKLFDAGLILADPRKRRALDTLRTLIADKSSGFLDIADAEPIWNYGVRIGKTGEFEILDGKGRPFANISPVITIAQANSAEKVLDRLLHLHKFETVQGLSNSNVTSPLDQKLVVELFVAAPDARSDKPPDNPQLLKAEDGVYTLKVGEKVYLHVKNNSEVTLNVAVLLLDVDWSIKQLFPSKNQGRTIPLEPGENDSIWKVVRGVLPDGRKEGLNTIKVLGTITEGSFRPLELPSIGNELPLKFCGRGVALGETRTRASEEEMEGDGPRNDWGSAQIVVRLIKQD